MLELEPLRRDQYAQVARWEFGENVNIDDYAGLLSEPQRVNFGVYQDGRFCASISMEQLGRIMRFHVSKERRTIHPWDLANLLITLADYLYQNGIDELEAAFPAWNRAARRLAIRSWMAPKGEYEQNGVQFQIFAIKKADYYGRINQIDSDSVRKQSANR
jgi:hypothetical protein